MFRRHSGLIGACSLLALVAGMWVLAPGSGNRSDGASFEVGADGQTSTIRTRGGTRHIAGGHDVFAPPTLTRAGLAHRPPPQVLPDDFPDRIVRDGGRTVEIPLPDGRAVGGEVTILRRNAEGVQNVQGRVLQPEPGRFFFQRQTVAGKAGRMVGFVHFDERPDAWQVRPDGPGGAPVLAATHVNRVMCRAFAAPPEPEAIPQAHPTDLPIPPEENGIIQLQSLPGVAAVVYLDFDGEERVFDMWDYVKAEPAGASNAQIFDVWRGVAEDFLPFEINVTTVRAVYDAAPQGSRMQVIITPTTTASPGTGGAAYTGSFNWAGEIVCWSFSTTGKNAVETISHEVGHTLGLSHHGRTSPAEEYYTGHGNWAPIMGVGYFKPLTQWSKGEYTGANNTQDDIQIIATNNNVTFRHDDHGASTTTATWLDIDAGGNVPVHTGIIGEATDADLFRFSTAGGDLTLTIDNATLHPNLDLRAEILDADSNILATFDPQDSLDAGFTEFPLAAGEYWLRVTGTGQGDPLGTGYTDYGSLGAYTLSGHLGAASHAEFLEIDEHSPAGTLVGTITPRADHGAGVPAFSILSGNLGGTFAIDPASGEITVASNSLLDFEELAPTWADSARFELFIRITDSLEVAEETLRVVIDVADINEAPDFPPPPSVTIPENLRPGTEVTTVFATDPDRGDSITWSITDGNAGNAFAIDPATGVIRAEGVLDFDIISSYVLTLRATDNGTPALWAEETLTIDLMQIAPGLEPGAVARSFFRQLPGSAVIDLTGSAAFPDRPHSEVLISSFDGGSGHGASFGSALRALLIAPSTGTYTFWISCDDAGELLLSTDDDPANAAAIASLASRVDRFQWNAQPSQQSEPVFLSAGQAYFIEARHQQDIEAEHIQVAWQPPGSAERVVIPGRWLVPYREVYTPWAEDAAAVVRLHAANGQAVTRLPFIAPNFDREVASHAITSGNDGGIFAIDPASGVVTVADGSALAPGDIHSLTIHATDDGFPPLAGSASLTIRVRGLDDGLHAWWPLDEIEGEVAADISGNGRDAMLVGAAEWITRAPANGALALDGGDSGFEVYGNHGLAGTTALTFAAWIRLPADHSQAAVLFQQQQAGPGGDEGRMVIEITATGHLRFLIQGPLADGNGNDIQFDFTSAAPVADGTWRHVACTREGFTGRIFLDGVESASASGTPRLLDPSLSLAAGFNHRTYQDFLAGEIDDLRLYSDALGAAQIQRVAGTPKLVVTDPAASEVDIPAGVGLMVETAASDPDGPPPTVQWSLVSGPGTVDFAAAGNNQTAVTFGAAGAYLLRATADDGQATVSRDLTVNFGSTSNSAFDLITIGGGPGGFTIRTGERSFILSGAASGIDVGSTADGFHLLGQSFTGDFDVRARVTDISSLDNSFTERAGLALRVGTAAAAGDVGGFIGFGDGDTGHYVRRSALGGANLQSNYINLPMPSWCRINRASGTIRYYHSADGVTWSSRGTILNSGEVLVGLAWTSGNALEPGNAAFDQISGFTIDNLGPLVTASGDTIAIAGLPASLTGSAEDDGRPAPPALAYLWQLAAGPGPVIFDHATAPNTTVTCSAAGNHTFRLVVDDGMVRTFAEHTLSAELLDIVGVTATVDEAAESGPVEGVFTFERAGSLVGELTVSFTLSGTAINGVDYLELPSFIVIPDGQTLATLHVVPIADGLVEGPESVVLTIVAGDYDISSESAQIIILDSNHAPEWSNATLTRADGDEDFLYSATSLAADASDPDGDPLEFSKTAGPAWLVVDPDGSLSGAPPPGSAGVNEFTVRATDPGGLFAEATLVIFVNFANDPPAFLVDPVSAPDAMAELGYSASLPPEIADDPNLPQGDVLSYSKSGGPGWLNIAPDGTLGGFPGNPDLGLNEFILRVSDAAGAWDETTLRIVVVPATLYLDTNGTEPGSGSPATVTWDNSPVWSPAAAGDVIPVTWIEGARAVFSAGDDPIDTVVTLDGTRTIDALTLRNGQLELASGGLALTGPAVPFVIDGSATIGSPLNGGGLIKSGAGTLILEGNHPLPGPLAVAGGALVLRGALTAPSAVAIEAGAVLRGGGVINGPLSVAGTLEPGEGAGSLEANAVEFLDGATYEWQCDSWTGDPGNAYDTLTAASLDFTAAGSFHFVLAAPPPADFTESSSSFVVAQTTGGITGFDPENAIINAAAFTGVAGQWSLRVDGAVLILDYTPPPPFVLWQIAEFEDEANNPLVAGELADPDNDGLPNLVEYALGTNPNLAGASPVTHDRIDIGGTKLIRLTIPRNPDATDVTMVVETTSDLSDPGSWSAIDTVIETDTPTLLVVRDALGGPRRFIRLRVTLTAP